MNFKNEKNIPLSKQAFLILCLSFLVAACEKNEPLPENATPSELAGKTFSEELQFGGLDREYLIHFPEGFNENEQYPLLLALHGGFGTGEQFEDYTGLSNKADSEGFIVVYPDGYFRTWNAGLCCGPAQNNNIDDIGFLSNLVYSLSNHYPINEEAVFATGISNGGFMAYRLLCEKPEIFTAIAPVAASMLVENCQPETPGSIIHIHSYQDEYVPYQGGPGVGPSDAVFPPLDSVLNEWANMNNCQVRNDTIVNNANYDVIQWTNCAQNTEIKLYITHDGGHSWPGASGNIPDPGSETIDANDVIWAFFEEQF